MQISADHEHVAVRQSVRQDPTGRWSTITDNHLIGQSIEWRSTAPGSDVAHDVVSAGIEKRIDLRVLVDAVCEELLDLALKCLDVAGLEPIDQLLGDLREFRIDSAVDDDDRSEIEGSRNYRHRSDHEHAISECQAERDASQPPNHRRTLCSRRRAPYAATAARSPCRSFAAIG